MIYLDINECVDDVDICKENANCTDTVGSYMCTCKEGYSKKNDKCEGIVIISK